jgi:hypothetical protein
MIYFVNASAKTYIVNSIKFRAHLVMYSRVIDIMSKYLL